MDYIFSDTLASDDISLSATFDSSLDDTTTQVQLNTMPVSTNDSLTNALDNAVRDLRDASILIADNIAQRLRLTSKCLPQGVDFSAEEAREMCDDLIPSMRLQSDQEMEPMMLAFSARHLPALAACITSCDRATQPVALSTYIQVLSLLPAPESNAYLRAFLSSPAATGLPNVIAWHFTRGLHWIAPSGPGHVCALLTSLLFWCDAALGDDTRASIDARLRSELGATLPLYLSGETTDRPREVRRLALERLAVVLKRIDCASAAEACEYLAGARRRHGVGRPAQRECCVCHRVTELLCSQCKTVRFCGKECQAVAWKDGHQLQCFTAAV
ncbi:zinc finger MYND domain-containing protein [Phanerochaete sordida]|uniref:Zinc finger MYND domain-containing protein n=1 Tax=Phanerochaete sordida TaxID=48140 RepID=A0A9P3GIX9_9APHY|nr:zinc finger MYND domain-containing protein [Phanerochaete sordida]